MDIIEVRSYHFIIYLHSQVSLKLKGKYMELKESNNFIEDIINNDLKDGKYKNIITRFPPEPNGYLHIGHAKSIWINFGIKEKYAGNCNLRFDDTNPEKENIKYINSIKEDISWLGYKWDNECYASQYFNKLYLYAEKLIKKRKAYVCDLTANEIRNYRGTLNTPGKESPYRNRTIEENLDLFRKMRKGVFPDGFCCLRAKIDMGSPNINMRDPLIYRIIRGKHHTTGNQWYIYPLYDFAHPLSDSIEGITHSICTLEFEDHRPLYNWFLQELDILKPRPVQIEFARLNFTKTVMSKRLLSQLVEKKIVTGWDDPRMPTISGARRRGYPANSIRKLCALTGIAKANSVIEIEYLETCVRDELNKMAQRIMAVLNPLKIIIVNYDKEKENLIVENNLMHDNGRQRTINFSRELYIEREDFMENPPPKYHRLTIGRYVRLKYGYIIKCINAIKDTTGKIIELHCEYYPESKSGQDKSGIKCKCAIHWVDCKTAVEAEVKIYDHLLSESYKNKVNFLKLINPNSLIIIKGIKLEPIVLKLNRDVKYQFLRQGYFWQDYTSSNDNLIFNRIISLKKRIV